MRIKPRALEPIAKPQRSARYRAWVRCEPCAVLGCEREDVEFAHTGRKGKGMGVKACDLDGIPLCSLHHRTAPAPQSYHSTSEWKWAAYHGINLEVVRKGLRDKWARLRLRK